jgi:hypothetical protein
LLHSMDRERGKSCIWRKIFYSQLTGSIHDGGRDIGAPQSFRAAEGQ